MNCLFVHLKRVNKGHHRLGIGVSGRLRFGKRFQINSPNEDLTLVTPSCNYSILVDIHRIDLLVVSTSSEVTGLKDKAEPFPLRQLLLLSRNS
jgi:hypothetical protein